MPVHEYIEYMKVLGLRLYIPGDLIRNMNIGYNPTYNSKQRTLEVHILDFDKDIYGDELQVEFVITILPRL